MEFEEMQVIWNEQKNEKLFAINEAALHKYIKSKGRSVERLLDIVQWMLIINNLLVVIILVVDAVLDNGPGYQFFIAAVYLAYSIYAAFRRLQRRKAEIHFDTTMLAELDKAIWRVDYLIRQANSMVVWYVLPLTVIVAGTFFLNGKPFWALAVIAVLVSTGLFGPRWEINKWYLPKKRKLEALRETLLADEGVVG